MLTSQMIKEYALKLGADKVGIGNIERWKTAPPETSPLSIMPDAKSVIVFIRRIPRGSYRGIEEGTNWGSYSIFGYTGINEMLRGIGIPLAQYIEHNGYEAAMLSSCSTIREIGARGNKVDPDKPRREVTVHHRISGVLAGVGEIGFSKVFLTEEFGPRQRIGVLLTDAELEPDPLVEPHVCDHCTLCARACPGAMPVDKTVKCELEGIKYEWTDIDIGKCKLAHFGLDKKTSPFLAKRFPGLNMKLNEQTVTWREAHDLGFAFFPTMPETQALYQFSSYMAICGARGCIRACMKHLENRGRLKNKFENQVFASQKYWELSDEPAPNDHQGFIFDPDNDNGELTPFQQAPSWY